MKLKTSITTTEVTFSPVSHVIFDFDGLLMDTESVYMKATQSVAEPYGRTFDWEHKSQVVGLSVNEGCQRIIDLLELPMSLDEFMERSREEIERMMPHAQLMPGVERLLEHFKQNGIPMAIATGSDKKIFRKMTSKYTDIFGKNAYFDHIVFAGEDPEVKDGKPAPDCFLVAAQRFDTPPVHPKSVLVFEDAPPGVHGALAGGMQVVMVPDPQLKHNVSPTMMVSSLEHFEPHLFSLPSFV